jgi:uncharacterized protein YjbJ (UPF0337 family)
MNWEQVEGQWDKVKGNVKGQWAKLTEDDLGKLGGKKDQLVGAIQQRYGVLKEEAEKQVHEWAAKLDHTVHAVTDKAVSAGDKVQQKIENGPTAGAGSNLPKA